MRANLFENLAELGRLLRKAGPYVVLEVVLPGGTLFAFLLYMYRTGQLRKLADVRAMLRGVLRSSSSAFDQLAFAYQPGGMPAGEGGRPPHDGLPRLTTRA